MTFNISLDGPSAAGKTTIAKAIAKRYNLVHIDTGAMYRAVAYYSSQYNLDYTNEKTMVIAAQNSQIEIDKNEHVYLNSIDITEQIRSEKIATIASHLSKHPKVRKILVERQQEIAANKGYILDGRDIGSVVLPDAEIKLFLTANTTERAKRRFEEYRKNDEDISFQEVFNSIQKRDIQDSTRKFSPLVTPLNAIIIDTTNLTIEEVIHNVFEVIDKYLGMHNE